MTLFNASYSVRSLRTVCLLTLIVSTFALSACASQRARIFGGDSKTVGSSTSFFPKKDKQAFSGGWYAGAALGNSRLDPDLSATGFSVQNDSSAATQFKAGYDLNDRFSFEFDSSVLGTAELESTAEVEYTSFTASSLIYGLTGANNRTRRKNWSAFGRFGYGLSNTASNVQGLDGRDLSGLIVGLGVEYGFNNGLGLRFEATRLHDEAVFAGLGAIFRFGKNQTFIPRLAAAKADGDADENSNPFSSNNRQVSVEKPLQAGLPGVFQQNPHPSHAASLTPRIPSSQANRYVSKVVVATAYDLDGDGVGNDADECLNTAMGVSVSTSGCGLFDGVVEGLHFNNGSYSLDSTAKQILDQLTVRLSAFPEVRVEVQAYTDSVGPKSINQSMSQARATAIVRYLNSKGVNKDQLIAVGKGESRPVADNETEQGRIANRRVELLTLPGRDIVPRHVTAVTPAAEVYLLNSRKVQGAKPKPAASKAHIAGNAIGKSKGAESTKEPEIQAAKAEQAKINVLPRAIPLPGTSINGVQENIDFAGRSTDLTAASQSALDGIVAQLQQYPTARIAIMAHTDSQGNTQQNLELSVNQANVIADNLVTRGIERKRLEIEGYGDELPLTQDLTAADRELNRRIELRVLAR